VNYYGDDPLYEYSAKIFFEDGTGLNFDKGNGGSYFLYMYDSQTKILTILEGTSVKLTYIVTGLTSNTLKLHEDWEDEDDTYKKQSSFLTNDKLILGKWTVWRSSGISSVGMSEVCFYADGTYEADDYSLNIKPEYFKDSFTGTYSITGNTITIKGQSQIAGEYTIETLDVGVARFLDPKSGYADFIGIWRDRY